MVKGQRQCRALSSSGVFPWLPCTVAFLFIYCIREIITILYWMCSSSVCSRLNESCYNRKFIQEYELLRRGIPKIPNRGRTHFSLSYHRDITTKKDARE